MRKLIFLGVLLGVFTIACAGSREVAGVSGGSASSTFGVGVPQTAKATAAAKAKSANKKAARRRAAKKHS